MHFERYFASHPQARYLYYLAKLGKLPNVTTLVAMLLVYKKKKQKNKKKQTILYEKNKIRTIYKDLQKQETKE